MTPSSLRHHNVFTERDPSDLMTIRDLSERYQKSDRHTRRIIASHDFPKPFRLGMTGRTLYWHFDEVVAWEKSQRPIDRIS